MEEYMNSAATWENTELKSAVQPDENHEPSSSASNITTLKELVLRLLSELQCLTEVNTLSIGDGLDFYEEVSRFEIDLIKRALLHTGGHQVQAARLLNLKVTTLNSKIKHYNINPGGFAKVYQLLETRSIEDHQHA